MLKPIMFLLLGIAAGVLAATWRGGAPATPALQSRPGADRLAERIEALEAALGRETLRRAALEAELDALGERFEQAPAAAADEPARDARTAQASIDDGAEPAVSPAPDFARRRAGRGGPEGLSARLVEAGFSPDRADYIEARAEALRMEALQAQYEARREGVPVAARAFGVDALRAELGDAEYERYLEATGRPTSVRVADVLSSSPAEQAGLAPGDEVVAYDGRRVFDMRDLNEMIFDGESGEPVIVDVLRAGQPIQVMLPRGPLGISGRGRR